jgi:hypothetical protein
LQPVALGQDVAVVVADGHLQMARGGVDQHPVGGGVGADRGSRAGRAPEAARALRRALGGFERLGEAFEAARTRERLAEVEPAGVARSLLEAALATYERLACAPRELAVRARLGAPS